MTPRERWTAIFAGEQPDRIPTDYWATDEVTNRLCNELGCADKEALYTKLNIDGLTHVNPERTVKHFPGDPEADIWGLRRTAIQYGTGSYDEFANHPLADMTTVEELHSYPWPSPDDLDYERFRKEIAAAPRHRWIRSGEFEPFLLYCALRGMENAMMDLLVEQEFVDTALEYIFRYHYAVNERIYDIGRGLVDVTYLAEDLGGQTALLFGIPEIRKFILPRQKKMADLAREAGVHIFYHTDGAAFDIIPDLLDVTRIELLNPIQWRCPGMERERLVETFGRRVIFHGAVDNQFTLPFGTVDDVQKEVLDNIRLFKDARWICAPCHNLQPVTPTANIITMYKTIHEFGRL